MVQTQGAQRVGGDREFRTGWAVLAACFLGLMVSPATLPSYTAGVFYGPLQGAFGWSRTDVSFAQSIVPMVFALASPFVGAAADRWGERRLIAGSLLCTVATLLLLSTMNGSLYLYWLYFGLMALTGAGATTLAFSRIVAMRFVKQRGFALGIALVGTGVTGLVAPYLTSLVIADWGWRGGYLALAAIVASAIPFILMPISSRGSAVAPPSAESPQQFDGTSSAVVFSSAIRNPAFWLMMLIFPMIALAGTGLIMHFVPLLVDQGSTPQQASALAGLTGVFMIVGRLVTGYLIDRFFAPRLAAMLMLACAAALGAMAQFGSAFAWCGPFAIGLAIGAEFDLMAYLVARYFRLAAFGRIYGWMYAAVVAAAAFSPVIYGQIRDQAGDYQFALFGAAALMALTSVMFMLMPRFPESVDDGTPSRPGLGHPTKAAVT